MSGRYIDRLASKNQKIYITHKAFLADAQPKKTSLLHCVEQAAEDIYLYMNANKTKYRCFKQKRSDFHTTLQA